MKGFVKRYFYHVKVNQVIQFMTYSDILLLTGWGLVLPIIAVFITDQIEDGSLVLAGIASTTYLLVKSVFQIPVARYIDLKKGEWDDFWIMVIGSLCISLAAFLYIFATLPIHVIAIQVIYGVGGALSFPSWQAIFTRHIDKSEEGLEWSLYFTATDLGGALAASIGGFVASFYGYRTLFVVVGIMSLVGTAFLAGTTHKLKKRS